MKMTQNFMNRKLNNAIVLFFIGTILLFASCYPVDDLYTDDLDLTVTQYNTEFNFSTYNNFVIRDSVGLLQNSMSDVQIADFYKDGGTADQLKSKTLSHFKALGYSEVTSIDNADFGINIVFMNIKTTSGSYYPWGWWGYYPGYYPGWGYPGWGWGYPGWGYPGWGYPSYGYTYSYEEGTILIEMVDGQSVRDWIAWTDGKTEEEIQEGIGAPEIEYQWQAFFNGLISSSQTYNEQRVDRAFKEAFEQSPYLKK